MNKNENHIPVFFAAIKLCFLICIGIGMAIFLAEFAGIQSSWLKLFMPVLLSAVICAALVLFLPSKLSCMLIAGGLWLAFVWINKTAIYGGAQTVYAIAENMVSAYFNNEEVQRTVLSGDSLKQVLDFFAAVLSAWQGFAVIANLKKSHPALTAVIPVMVIVLYLAAGQVPCWISLILFGAGFAGLISINVGADKNYKAALQSAAVAVILFAAVTGAVVWAMPPEGYLKEENKTYIRTAVRDSYRDFGEYLNERMSETEKNGMGIGEGKLDKAGNLSYTGETVMRVSTNRQVPAALYLKAYAARNFEKNRWTEIDSGGLDDVSAAYDADTGEYLRAIWNNSYQASVDDTEAVMTISPSEAVSDHVYIPYASILGNGDNMAAEGYVTALSGGQKRDIYYADQFFSMMADADSYIGSGSGGGRLKSYTGYVRENYMSVEGMSDRFKNDYKIADGSSPGTVTDYIKETFESVGLRYTLEPGTMPRGENVIEYFLYENKKGYCMHFASAAVMIYRLNGIPARYAEGYVIPRGSFKQHASGYDAGGSPEFISEIRDYQAHAWPEIYIEDFGWVPAEVTPAYTNGSIPEALTKESETAPSESEESETAPSGSEESETAPSKSEESESAVTGEKESTDNGMGNEADENSETKANATGIGGAGNRENTGGSQGGAFKVLPVVFRGLLAVLAAAVLCVCFVSIAKFRTRQAAALLKPPYDSRTTKALWRYLMRWLILYGVRSAKSGDSEAIMKEMAEKSADLGKQKDGKSYKGAADDDAPDANALAYIFDKLLKSAYSRQGLEAEEYVRVICLYRQFAQSIYGQLSPHKKMAAVFLWCLPGKGESRV